MRLRFWMPDQVRHDGRELSGFLNCDTVSIAGIQRDKIGVNKQFYVYILASKRNGPLYTGVTSNLIQRIWQHKNNMIQGFTGKYVEKSMEITAYRKNESAMEKFI